VDDTEWNSIVLRKICKPRAKPRAACSFL
jgi:hypothetical protein